MTTCARIIFEFDSDWNVTIYRPGREDKERIRRRLRAAKAGAFAFPLPPEDDLPPENEPHRELCAGDAGKLVGMYRRIVGRQPDTKALGDIASFGMYLFQTLIGKEWERIRDLCGDSPPDFTELALSWDASDIHLHRLNWESMHDGRNFLAAASPEAVAITRLVKADAPSFRKIDDSARILFVSGVSLSDPEIRPAAEYFGLLRHVERQNRRINSRVLQWASVSKIKEAMAEFKPHVVHFICHGDVDQNGKGYLILQPDEGEKERKRDSIQLLQSLKADNVFPQVVVLAACRTGEAGPETTGPERTAPLAAELVQGGIPIVVGMAGSVSDLACRLFTRRFGDSLLGGTPVVLACAQGRQFALARGLPPRDSIDWALPAVFASERIDPDFRLSSATDDQEEENVVGNWIASYDLERTKEPVFCGRDDCFEAYRRLFSDKPVLLIRGSRAMGKTRLVRELAAKAIQDGNIPVVVSSDNPLEEPPRTMDALREALVDAVFRACSAFELDFPNKSRLVLLENPDDPELDSKIRTLLKIKKKVTAQVLLTALAADLAQMAKQARRRYNLAGRFGGKPVVMLDRVQEYDKEFLMGLHDALGRYGLGADKNNPIPLVMAFAQEGPAFEILKSLVEKRNVWQNAADLDPFSPDRDEDLMVYKRVLLHPFDDSLYDDISGKAFAVNEGADPSVIRLFFGSLRDGVRGIPGEIPKSTFYMLVPMALKLDALVEADDEALLEEMRNVL